MPRKRARALVVPDHRDVCTECGDTVLFLRYLWISMAFVWLALEACTPATSPAAAEAALTTELLQCVDQATTPAESKACRREVHARWGITETVRDGGAE